MSKSVFVLIAGLLLLVTANISVAVPCMNMACDGSYNIVISNNDDEVDAMFTIQNDDITEWMWIDVPAAMSFGVNALPTVNLLDDSILTGAGLGVSFVGGGGGPFSSLDFSINGTFVQAVNGNTSPCPIPGPITGQMQVFFSCEYEVSAKAVPEPTALVLMGLGIAGLGFRRKTT